MNTKIFKLLTENLHQTFGLEKYSAVRENINANTVVEDLPWTPARYRKFKDAVEVNWACPANTAEL
jgi:hypothetical protein